MVEVVVKLEHGTERDLIPFYKVLNISDYTILQDLKEY